MISQRIDTVSLNRSVDLMTLTGAHAFKRVAAAHGGEYAGPCPFCGGNDRFHIQPNHSNGGRWLCRQCTEGRWNDAIAFVQKRDSVSFIDATKYLAGSLVLTAIEPRKLLPVVAKPAPDDDWQSNAMSIIEVGERRLWTTDGNNARAWLNSRGLKNETINYFRLGLHTYGNKLAGGITIPCIASERIWYLKSRRQWGDVQPAGSKYGQLPDGVGTAVFNYDHLKGKTKAVLIEGELDMMLVWQELQGTDIGVASLGSNTPKIDLATWGRHFYYMTDIATAYDCDDKSDRPAKALASMSRVMRQIVVPLGKDPSSFRMAGGNIRQWLTNEMGIEAITMTWPADTKATLPNRAKTLADGRIECRYSSRLALAEAMLPILQGNERDAVAGQIYIERLKMGIDKDSIFT